MAYIVEHIKRNIQETYAEIKQIRSHKQRSKENDNGEEELMHGLYGMYKIIKTTILQQLLGLQKIVVKIDNEAKILLLDKEMHSIQSKSYQVDAKKIRISNKEVSKRVS